MAYRTILRIAMLALFGGTFQLNAHAYYDDVHYALTYYIARQSGYTPQQAYRVASACSMVDWDPETEPVQGGNQAYLLFTKMATAAQKPRCKFHAMRDETTYDDVLGTTGKDALEAQGAVLKRRETNWQLALKTGNPGVFLHAFQDEKPHHGYGTAWGHWPMLPGCVAEYKAAGLLIGGGTDWIGTRVYDVKDLCRTTNDWLSKFIDANSPHQFARPFYEAEYSKLVDALAVKPPAPIDSELKRQIYIQFYAKANGITQQYWGNLVDPTELSNIGSQLGVTLTPEDLNKQKNGPSTENAIRIVNSFLKAAGMDDTVPTHHIRYDFDAEGRQIDESMMDKWVLTGSMQTSIRGEDSVTATLKMVVRDRSGKPKEMDLHGVQPVQMKANVPQKWTKVPIGEVSLVLKKKDGSESTHKFLIDKRENVFPPIRLGDNEGIGGHWFWERPGKDEKGKAKIDLVPAYLTPQEDGGFNGVYFPYLTYESLRRTPNQSPTRIKFKPQSGNVFTFTWQYPNGPKGTGTMTVSGAAMTGQWVEDGNGSSGNWKWIRPSAAQLAKLREFFGR